ncbi:MAG TPA: hypothetical protein ENH97_03890, partial [bacterium]|nr:hypothetical protein [bacterium]
MHGYRIRRREIVGHDDNLLLQGGQGFPLPAQEIPQYPPTHLLILKDPYLIKKVTQGVKEKLINVEYAFSQVLETLQETFGSIEDSYL